MSRWIALLRGINLGSRNRVSMPDLRAHLTGLGYEDVATVVASGNVAFTKKGAKAQRLERDLQATIAERFGVDTPVIVRSARELAAVVDGNPFQDAGGKELHVLFLAERCPADSARALEALELEPEGLVVSGREVYMHYANGMRDSPMGKVAGKHLKVTGTDRNWNTVLKLRALTRDGPARP